MVHQKRVMVEWTWSFLTRKDSKYVSWDRRLSLQKRILYVYIYIHMIIYIYYIYRQYIVDIYIVYIYIVYIVYIYSIYIVYIYI